MVVQASGHWSPLDDEPVLADVVPTLAEPVEAEEEAEPVESLAEP